MTSTKLIALAKERFKQLEHKEYDWQGFYHGFLEGFVKANQKLKKRYEMKLFIGLMFFGIASFVNGYLLNYDIGDGFYSVVSYIVLATTIYLIIKYKIK